MANKRYINVRQTLGEPDPLRLHYRDELKTMVRAMAEAELLNLHEGNFARYRVRPSEFQYWWKVW